MSLQRTEIKFVLQMVYVKICTAWWRKHSLNSQSITICSHICDFISKFIDIYYFPIFNLFQSFFPHVVSNTTLSNIQKRQRHLKINVNIKSKYLICLQKLVFKFIKHLLQPFKINPVETGLKRRACKTTWPLDSSCFHTMPDIYLSEMAFAFYRFFVM